MLKQALWFYATAKLEAIALLTFSGKHWVRTVPIRLCLFLSCSCEVICNTLESIYFPDADFVREITIRLKIFGHIIITFILDVIDFLAFSDFVALAQFVKC